MKNIFTQQEDRCFGPVEISEGCPIPVNYQVSAEDIEDTVVDSFGVRYSADGTRLIGFEERLPRRYAVKPGCQVICCSDDSEFSLSAPDCFDDLEELILPEGLEVIADNAFYGLRRVKHLVIPSSVRFIGNGAFEVNPFGDGGLDFADDGLTIIPMAGTQPSPVSHLERVDILSSDIFIYNYAFFGQSQLSSLNFASSTSSDDEVRIGRDAFGDCTSLRHLSLPSGISLCDNPFIGCPLVNVHTDPHSNYHFSNGFLTLDEEEPNASQSSERLQPNASERMISNMLVGYYGSDSEVVIPADINAIGNYAFARNAALRRVVLPRHLVAIGTSAFLKCTSLVALTIPSLVEHIGSFAFSNCTALKSVTIYGPVATLADGLFFDCSALEELELPDSIKSLRSNVFHRCRSLVKLTLPPHLEHIDGNPFADSTVSSVVSLSPHFKVENDMLVDLGSNTLLAYFGCADELSVPDGILQIGTRAFEGNSRLCHIALPASLQCIGEMAFCRCTGLRELSLPPAVSSIGPWACCYCVSLSRVSFNEGLSHIGRYAFDDCGVLKETVIPQSVKVLENFAFPQGSTLTFEGIPQLTGVLPLVTFRVPKAAAANDLQRLLRDNPYATIIEY